jgi:hypothetical protein
MSKLTAEKRLMTHAELTVAIAQLIAAALKDGFPAEDIVQILTRAIELLESAEE